MQRKLSTMILAAGLILSLLLSADARLSAGDDAVEKLLATNWRSIATKLKAKKGPVLVDLFVKGQTLSVELMEIDATNSLVYKAFGQKVYLAFTEATATQIAGILQAVMVEESETAAMEHLNIGLLYTTDGKSVEAANEINKAITLDSTLDQVAKEQLKQLPRPQAVGSNTAEATAAILLGNSPNGAGGAGAGVGTEGTAATAVSYKPTPQGTNQEGRTLGAIPKLTGPVMFYTP